MASTDDDYEYNYSDEEDDYVVEDSDDDGAMEWAGTDNPQTPTTISGTFSSSNDSRSSLLRSLSLPFAYSPRAQKSHLY